MKKILFIPIFALLITVLSFLPQDAHAFVAIDVSIQDNCEAAPISGTWIASNSTCQTSANLTLNHGDELFFENVTLVSSGVINNSGIIFASAIGQPIRTGHLINYGDININNDGQIRLNYGFITNAKQGTINNNGSILIDTASKKLNIWGMTNSGTINNYNLIHVDGGFFKNLVHGVLNNNGTFSNGLFGFTTNKFGATIHNYGTINNTAANISGAIFKNLGSITNNGSIFNQIVRCSSCGSDFVVFNNSGIIDNPGSIFNEIITCSSCQPDSVVFNNTGKITNSGAFNNSQKIEESCAGTITGNPVSGNPPVIDGCLSLHNTATTVTPNPAATNVGTKITFHVKVIDSTSGLKVLPTGLVTWDDGGAGGTFNSSICTLTPLTSISACAIAYTSPATAGPVTITASYAGDSNHNPSSGTSALTVS